MKILASIERTSTYRGIDLTYCALRIAPMFGTSQFNHDRPLALAPFTNISDPVICCLIAALGRDLSMGQVPGAAYIEYLAALVLHRVSDLGIRADSMTDRKPLPPRAVASEPRHFRRHARDLLPNASRHVRATPGPSPYAYVTALRIERAQWLLRTTDIDGACSQPRLFQP